MLISVTTLEKKANLIFFLFHDFPNIHAHWARISKKYLGFLIPKIFFVATNPKYEKRKKTYLGFLFQKYNKCWSIFSRHFHQAQTLKLWGVLYVSIFCKKVDFCWNLCMYILSWLICLLLFEFRLFAYRIVMTDVHRYISECTVISFFT